MLQDNYILFEKLTVGLSNAWKDYFGLGTQYVGYLNYNQIVLLLTLKREELNNKSLVFKELSLDDLNVEAINRGLEPFSYNKEVENVLPELYKQINSVDFSSFDDETWGVVFDYLKTLGKKQK